MSRYVDGFVLPVPKSKLDAYIRMSRKAAKLWKKHGALDYRECVGEDLDPKPDFKGVPFPKMAKTKEGETVVFSWILYKSRKHRDKVNAKVMADPKIAKMCGKDMPFDYKRMAYGGFKSIVHG